MPLLFVPLIMGRFTDRAGPRVPILLGAGLTTVGLAWLAAVLSEASYLLVAPGNPPVRNRIGGRVDADHRRRGVSPRQGEGDEHEREGAHRDVKRATS